MHNRTPRGLAHAVMNEECVALLGEIDLGAIDLHAAVALSANATVYGSLFVRRLDQAAPLTIHYDVDVRRADIACPP